MLSVGNFPWISQCFCMISAFCIEGMSYKCVSEARGSISQKTKLWRCPNEKCPLSLNPETPAASPGGALTPLPGRSVDTAEQTSPLGQRRAERSLPFINSKSRPSRALLLRGKHLCCFRGLGQREQVLRCCSGCYLLCLWAGVLFYTCTHPMASWQANGLSHTCGEHSPLAVSDSTCKEPES